MSDVLAPASAHPDKHRPIYPALDGVRFLAAMLVMVYHLFYLPHSDLLDASDRVRQFWRFGWVGVEIFFTLSGLVIAYSAKRATAATFLIDRTVRLAPTIWICASISLLLLLIFWHSADLHQLLIDYLWTVVLRPYGRHINAVYWTLTVEIAFYVLVFCMLRWSNFRSLLRAMIIIGAVSAAFNSVLALSPLLHEWWPRLTEVALGAGKVHITRLLLLRHGCFFALGVLIWSLKDESRPKYCAPLIALFLGGGTMEVWYEAQSQLANTPALHCSPLSPVLAWLVGTSAIFLSRLLRPIQLPRGVNWVSILRYCGLLTFPVYLIHDDVGLVIEDRLSMFGFDSAALAAIAVVLVLSMLVTSFVEPPLARSLKVFLRRVFLKEVRGPLSAQPGAANRL